MGTGVGLSLKNKPGLTKTTVVKVAGFIFRANARHDRNNFFTRRVLYFVFVVYELVNTAVYSGRLIGILEVCYCWQLLRSAHVLVAALSNRSCYAFA